MARKTRSDARLPKLTKEQKETLLHWMDDENLKIAEIVRLIYSEFDIKTNKTSVSTWYSSYCFSRDVCAAAESAAVFKENLTTSPTLSAFLDDDTISRAAQARFESLVVRDDDVEGHVALRKLRQKDRDQRLAERSLDSAETGFRLKFEQKEKEIALQREKFELQKHQMKEQIASLQKNLQAPDAPLRLAKLVELIDAL